MAAVSLIQNLTQDVVMEEEGGRGDGGGGFIDCQQGMTKEVQ